MDKAVLESLKGKGREERQAYFKEHKSELVDMMLSVVNGGARQREKENPNSENPDPTEITEHPLSIYAMMNSSAADN